MKEEKKESDTGTQEEFRDKIATIDEKGKRVYIHPTKPKGPYYTKRGLLSVVYLLVFFGLPFVKVNGDPLFLANIVERKFILFGAIFWPQDFFLFGLGMLIFIIFIALFTVAFGRIFCGWACPQTIFMEMVFRKIEYWIDGDANYQIALAKAPWSAQKIVKRAAKYSIFYAISFVIASTMLSYIIGADEVLKFYTEPFSKHAGGIISLGIFSAIFFLVYAWFREQVCLIVCPYGRMQGVLLDKNSIVVAYDYVRGEPRHKFKKNEEAGKGDCVDCGLCVKVCPTGIDIRNGTQLECVNCTACIDVCDHIMESVHRPKGLIRYASETNIVKKEKTRFTGRMKAYSLVLVLLICVEGFLLFSRSDVDASIQRAKGLLYQEQTDGKISNLFTIKLLNKTRNNYDLTLKVENMKGDVKMISSDLKVQEGGMKSGEFFLLLNKKDLKGTSTKVSIGIYNGTEKIKTVNVKFLGPVVFDI